LYRLLLTVVFLSAFHFFTIAQDKRFVFTEGKMGSPFTIILYHEDSAIASRVAAGAFRLVDSFVNIYSDYIQTSELSRMSASAGKGIYMPVSPGMLEMLQLSRHAYKCSDHSFDITIGPLSVLWRAARKQKKIPSPAEIASKKALVGTRYIKISNRRKAVKLKKAGMRLDLGGIAQGYIANKVLIYIRQQGILSVLVDVSGDIAAGSPPPGRASWVLGVNLPEAANGIHDKKLRVSNLSVSTSGDIYQYLEFNGIKYSHIIDPRTGYGITDRKNITVIAKDATTADWLATACSVLPLKKAMKLVEKHDAALLAGYLENGQLKTATSKGFNKYWQ
jgi:FAD:protein FMN transferase